MLGNRAAAGSGSTGLVLTRESVAGDDSSHCLVSA